MFGCNPCVWLLGYSCVSREVDCWFKGDKSKKHLNHLNIADILKDGHAPYLGILHPRIWICPWAYICPEALEFFEAGGQYI